MGYVPDLIPKRNKVLPDYFKGNHYTYSRKNPLTTILGYIGALFFVLSALAYISAPAVAVLFGTVAFILLPPGHYLIEKKLRFKFTPLIKLCTCALLVIIALPFIDSYSKAENIAATEKAKQAEKDREQQLVAEQNKQARKDSFNLRLGAITALAKSGKLDSANSAIEAELRTSQSEDETAALQREKARLLRAQVMLKVKRGKYADALPVLSDLLERNPSDGELYYNRGLCYSKSGKIPEAVADLKKAMEYGSEDAKKLYEKVNPIRKHVVGYCTLCCDGSTSDATGRGACSWHGGVCEWNHPIYEESRKYE